MFLKKRFNPLILITLYFLAHTAWADAELTQTQTALASAQARLTQLEQTDGEIAQSLANTRARLEIGGFTEALSDSFLSERRHLRDVLALRFELHDVHAQLNRSRLRAIDLREEVEQADETGRPGLQTLANTYRELQSALEAQEMRLQAILENAEELDHLLAQQLLWWPSHRRIGIGWLQDFPRGLSIFLRPAEWWQAGDALLGVSVYRPLFFIFAVLLAAGLWLASRPWSARLKSIAEFAGHPYSDNFTLTLRAIGWCLLRALPLPLALYLLYRALIGLPEQGAMVEGLGMALRFSVYWLFAGYFLLAVLHRHGIGPVHFGWDAQACQRWRRQLRWFVPLFWPLAVVLILAFNHPEIGTFDSVGRLAILAMAAVLMLFALPLVRTDHGMAPGRRMLKWLGPLGIIGLGMMALTGYLLTANTLLLHGFYSVCFVVLILLSYYLLLRITLLVEQRLELQRRREEQRQAETAIQDDAGIDGMVIDLDKTELSLDHVDVQVRALLRLLALAALVIGFFLIWRDILPALTLLDEIHLWSRGDDGSGYIGNVSLQDVLLGVLVVVGAFMVMRNLAGTMEVLLFQRTGIDASMRYTITALTRYALTITVLVVLSNLLGMRWSELQWLIAALTVGLGFGLQEIVGNLVSGVIVLFERPVRVGDTITLGEYSGSVTRIRTRATTIVDWDNREIVIPNKAFITEKLINWTLSDAITRIVITVGISYEADPEQAREILLQVANQHPSVMDEPAPAALFAQFGASTLDLELRAYVREVRERRITISELNTQIIRSFRDHGIEIAYPQLDLHVKQ